MKFHSTVWFWEVKEQRLLGGREFPLNLGRCLIDFCCGLSHHNCVSSSSSAEAIESEEEEEELALSLGSGEVLSGSAGGFSV